LRQKLDLFDAMTAKHGMERTRELYREVCPIVGATIGQHVRHSNDHVERAVDAAAAASLERSSSLALREIHYDVRERGGADETDIDAATERIRAVDSRLEELLKADLSFPVEYQDVQACFMLSGSDGTEYRLPSTVGRELGFAAHHAIHHMAMIRVMVTQNPDVGLSNDDGGGGGGLPRDFGRAPSTVHYEQHSGADGKRI